MAQDLPPVPPPPGEPPPAPPKALTNKQRLLVKLGLPMLDRIVAEISRKNPSRVTEADLIGPGGVALHDAALTYREGPGSNFLHYAACHIRGRLIDALYGQRPTLRARVEKAMERVFTGVFQDLVLDVNMVKGTKEELREAMLQSGADLMAASYVASVLEQQQATPEEEMIELEGQRDSLAALDEAIQALDPPQREVIELVYWKEMELKQIAKELDLHVNTAQNRRKSAIRALRERLRERES